MLLDASRSQLVLVDFQSRLMPAIFEVEATLRNAVLLGRFARLVGVPSVATEQCPEKLGPNAIEIRELSDHTLSKTHFGAVADGLSDRLRANASRNMIVIAGCEAHVCLMQTALGLIDRLFEVSVVVDACSSRTVRNRDAAFARLAQAGAQLVTTEMVGFEWLRDANHPAFRDFQALIR